jgi:hypothetical protein
LDIRGTLEKLLELVVDAETLALQGEVRSSQFVQLRKAIKQIATVGREQSRIGMVESLVASPYEGCFISILDDLDSAEGQETDWEDFLLWNRKAIELVLESREVP